MNILGCCLIVAAQLIININTKIAVLLFVAGIFYLVCIFLRKEIYLKQCLTGHCLR